MVLEDPVWCGFGFGNWACWCLVRCELVSWLDGWLVWLNGDRLSWWRSTGFWYGRCTPISCRWEVYAGGDMVVLVDFRPLFVETVVVVIWWRSRSITGGFWIPEKDHTVWYRWWGIHLVPTVSGFVLCLTENRGPRKMGRASYLWASESGAGHPLENRLEYFWPVEAGLE